MLIIDLVNLLLDKFNCLIFDKLDKVNGKLLINLLLFVLKIVILLRELILFGK